LKNVYGCKGRDLNRDICPASKLFELLQNQTSDFLSKMKFPIHPNIQKYVRITYLSIHFLSERNITNEAINKQRKQYFKG